MTKRKGRPNGRRQNRLTSNSIPKRVTNVKASLPPVIFYLEELPGLAPRQDHGWIDGGLCPFHSDKHAGSFKINLDTGAFRCFSCGAAGGDIIAFYRLRYCCGFMDALRDLEGRCNLWIR